MRSTANSRNAEARSRAVCCSTRVLLPLTADERTVPFSDRFNSFSHAVRSVADTMRQAYPAAQADVALAYPAAQADVALAYPAAQADVALACALRCTALHCAALHCTARRYASSEIHFNLMALVPDRLELIEKQVSPTRRPCAVPIQYPYSTRSCPTGSRSWQSYR